MRKCKFCGADIGDEVKFCPSCGAMTDMASAAKAVTAKQYTTDGYTASTTKRTLNGLMLAWSIVNTALSFLLCCYFRQLLPSLVLGVIAIVFTALAKGSKTNEHEKNRLRTAKLLNITASCILAFFIFLFAIWAIFNFPSRLAPALWRLYYRLLHIF